MDRKHFGHLALSLVNYKLTTELIQRKTCYFYCQALVPSPVPLDPNPKQSQINSNWDWGDTIITWVTHPTPLITFNKEGVIKRKVSG